MRNFVYSCGCRLIKQEKKIAETISTPVREGNKLVLNGGGNGK